MVNHLVNRHIGTVKPKETTECPPEGVTYTEDNKKAEQLEATRARTNKRALQLQFLDPENEALEELTLAETHPITR